MNTELAHRFLSGITTGDLSLQHQAQAGSPVTCGVLRVLTLQGEPVKEQALGLGLINNVST
jgi:hypothetical protein